MRSNTSLLLLAAGLLAAAAWLSRSGSPQAAERPVVRLAEIAIDPQQIEQYKAALREGIDSALRLEPGVRALYAVSVKDHPDQIRVFELYASEAAYEAHLETPHFRKYKATTQGMVRSLKLVETDPILLGSR